MTKEDVISKVDELLKDHMGLDQVKSEDYLEGDCGMDSLDCIECVMGCEKEFNISIQDDEIENLNTVSDVSDIICKKLNL